MSDESATPSGPEPIPLSQARPVRPPTGKKPPPSPRPPSKVKAYLVIGIIVSSVLLIAAIGWRLYVKFSQGKGDPPRNVAQEFEDAWATSKKAQDDCFKIQAGVWNDNKELTPQDLGLIKSALLTYQKTNEAFHELNATMQKAGKTDSGTFQDIGERLIVLKTWIWDANGVLDPASKPPKYGGFYIPMYTAEKRREAAVTRLKEIRGKAAEISARKDVAEIEAAIKDVRALIDTFGAIRDDLLQLDDDLLKGLTLPDLKVEQLKELEELRDYQGKAGMGIKEAREVRSQLPNPDDLKPRLEPPKEPPKDPPKDEKKEEPPKEEPPKEEPPK